MKFVVVQQVVNVLAIIASRPKRVARDKQTDVNRRSSQRGSLFRVLGLRPALLCPGCIPSIGFHYFRQSLPGQIASARARANPLLEILASVIVNVAFDVAN